MEWYIKVVDWVWCWEVCFSLCTYSSALHCFVGKMVNAKQRKSIFGQPKKSERREHEHHPSYTDHTEIKANRHRRRLPYLKVQVSTSTTPTERPAPKAGQSWPPHPNKTPLSENRKPLSQIFMATFLLSLFFVHSLDTG